MEQSTVLPDKIRSSGASFPQKGFRSCRGKEACEDGALFSTGSCGLFIYNKRSARMWYNLQIIFSSEFLDKTL